MASLAVIIVTQFMMWLDSQEEAQQQRWSVSRGGLHHSGDVRHVVVFLSLRLCVSVVLRVGRRSNAQVSLDSSPPLVGVRAGDRHT